MILVHRIVAMHRIVPQEVAKRKEDSNFLFRMAVTAGSAAADTAALQVKFLHWAQVGVAKFPTNMNLLGQVVQAYKNAGMVDSVFKITDRILAQDSTDMTPALSAIDGAITALRWTDAIRYGTLVSAHGDAQQKLSVGAAFTNAARTLLTQTAPPPDRCAPAPAPRRRARPRRSL